MIRIEEDHLPSSLGWSFGSSFSTVILPKLYRILEDCLHSSVVGKRADGFSPVFYRWSQDVQCGLEFRHASFQL
jgi:hypothetical protein